LASTGKRNKHRHVSLSTSCVHQSESKSMKSFGTLTFQSLAVTLHQTRLNIEKFYVVPTLRLCVLYGSQNKQQLLPYKTLRDWFS
jgi:hypothetical protein